MAGNTTQTHSYLWWSPDGISMVPVSATNPLPVTGSGGGGGGTSSSFGATFPAVGTAVGAISSTGTMAGLNLDSSGNLKIAGSITASNPSVSTTGAAVPGSATFLGVNVGGNLTGVTGTANGIKVDGSAVTQPVSGSVTVTQTTAANLNATVTGSVSVTNFPATQPVSGTVAATQSGTWNVGLSAGSNVVGKVSIDQTTPGTTNAVSVTNFPGTQPVSGTVAATQSGTWTNTVTQATAANLNATVVGTGTFTTQAQQSGTWNIGTVTTVTGVTSAFGATASSVPSSGVYEGLRGTTALPTAVTDGQLVGSQADKFGRQVNVPFAVRDLVAAQVTTVTSTSETTIVTAIASTFNDLVSLNFVNSGATAVELTLRDTTGGSAVGYFYVPAGDMRGQTYSTPFPQTAVNTNWTIQASGATTSLRITAQYVKNK